MDQPPLPVRRFRNEGLFADHYLQDVLPQTPELWLTEGMEDVRKRLAAIWEDHAAEVADYEESQLEEHFIKPVLEVLGHVWEVQPRAGQHQPDYGFFPDDETRVGVLPADGRADYWAKALAVGDAKRWDRKLDKADTSASGWDFQNPSFQIYYYLAETGCPWAILTNGRHWRLYSSEPKPDMQRFYEVDLPELLEADDPDHFAYFWLFFRRQSSRGPPPVRQASRLSRSRRDRGPRLPRGGGALAPPRSRSDRQAVAVLVSSAVSRSWERPATAGLDWFAVALGWQSSRRQPSRHPAVAAVPAPSALPC